MWGPCSENILGAYARDQNERPNDRVLFSFCQLNIVKVLAILKMNLTH